MYDCFWWNRAQHALKLSRCQAKFQTQQRKKSIEVHNICLPWTPVENQGVTSSLPYAPRLKCEQRPLVHEPRITLLYG